MSITPLNDQIIDVIQLAAKYPTITRIGIFGSYARGENDDTSDIDLLYDYEGDFDRRTDDLLEYVDEIDGILKKITNVSKIDYVYYKDVLKSQNEKFKQSVLKDVIWIYNHYICSKTLLIQSAGFYFITSRKFD